MILTGREIYLAARPGHGFREALDQRLADAGFAGALLCGS
jgi:hypothetical protein